MLQNHRRTSVHEMMFPSSPFLPKFLHLLIMILIDPAYQRCNSHCPGVYPECSQLHLQFPAGLLDLLGSLLLCLLCHSRMQYPAQGIRHAATEKHASTVLLRILTRPTGLLQADIIRTMAQTATSYTLPQHSTRTNEYGMRCSCRPLQRTMQMWSGPHLATTGVMPIVRGTLTGRSAFVHRNATAKDDPLLVSALANQDLSSGFASACTSFSAQYCPSITYTQASCPP